MLVGGCDCEVQCEILPEGNDTVCDARDSWHYGLASGADIHFAGRDEKDEGAYCNTDSYCKNRKQGPDSYPCNLLPVPYQLP